MHREISYADRAFGEQESRLSLFLLTGLVGVILFADLWPFVAAGLAGWGVALPTWSNEIGGYRIALLAAVLGGARILYGSLDSLLQGRLGADLALAIACISAILIRESAVAAELVFVGLLGECLEHLTFSRTQQALRRLAELTPRRCWRLRDGKEERVLVSELQVGDHVVVKPGARIPADGVVLEGRSALDTGALTGESLPVDKGPGDEVLAGSLNQHGALTIQAQRLAEHSVLGRVVEMTARALQDRAPSERTADRLARYFLPAVLVVAALTFLVGLLLHFYTPRSLDLPRPGLAASIRYAIYPALSVLVVACPCALILATPAAVIAALGRLAGTGVLLKSGSALERLAGVDTLAFDKTGTLTEGRLELADVLPLASLSADELLRLAGSVEQSSEHPLGRLVVREAQSRQLALEPCLDFLAHPGSGVSARLTSGSYLIGNRRLLEEQSVTLGPEALALLERLDAAGQTVLFVSRDGQVLGAIGARDRIRPEARAVLDDLRRSGIGRLVMLTGDRQAVARNVASQLGVEEVHAELLPQQKAGLIAEWQAAGPPQRVAMVGDGINDAPALAGATVGLAIGGTTNDVAAEAGDVVLLIGPGQGTGESPRDPLQHLPLLVRLSRETVRIIRQNIYLFAFGVNAVGIVLTAWLWPFLLPPSWHESGPIAAVVYHQLGSLLVLLNSMRLLWFESAEGSTVHRWSGRVRAINAWLERHGNLDEVLHTASHYWREIGLGLVGLGLIVWGGSGLAIIGPDEVGLLQRFGKLAPGSLEPGLHIRWPWPIETVTRIKPAQVRTVAIGFRLAAGSRLLPGARSWSSVHSEGLSREPEEAVMLTGDGNLLELQGSLRYTISDPGTFLFGVAQPERALRNAAESVLREVVASEAMARLLTTDRGRLQQEVRRRLETRCADLGLGLRLEGVSLHDLHPPQEVVQAYHEVTRAMERRDREVNQAQADRLRRLRDQEARSLEMTRTAEAERFERIRLARARLGEFLARVRSRNRLPWLEEIQLFLAAQGDLERGCTLAQVRPEYQAQRRERIAQQQALTDFRQYWDSLTLALAGRPKVVVDSEKLPGRRSLWLVPFEPPTVPPPTPAAPRRRNSTDEP
ncbi:MAG: cation-translocating P-type ATPase family protein [Gemmataceae bacterium]